MEEGESCASDLIPETEMGTQSLDAGSKQSSRKPTLLLSALEDQRPGLSEVKQGELIVPGATLGASDN